MVEIVRAHWMLLCTIRHENFLSEIFLDAKNG